MNDVTCVIPAMNEENGIGKVISDVFASGVNSVVVVDRSSDRTPDIAKSLGATVIREERRGYGRAYKTGFDHVSSGVIVTLDADGTYPANLIPSLVSVLDSEGLDFISCARDYSRVMSLKHKLGNFVLTLFSNILFGKSIKDSQSGMWVFRRSCLSKMVLESDGMAFSEEIKIEAIRRGLRFKEVTVPYGERIGEVKLDGNVDGVKNLIYLFKLRLRK